MLPFAQSVLSKCVMHLNLGIRHKQRTHNNNNGQYKQNLLYRIERKQEASWKRRLVPKLVWEGRINWYASFKMAAGYGYITCLHFWNLNSKILQLEFSFLFIIIVVMIIPTRMTENQFHNDNIHTSDLIKKKNNNNKTYLPRMCSEAI